MRKLVAVSVFLGVVAVICGPAAGGAAAQTNSYTNMLNTIQTQNQSWYNQLNAYNRQFGGAARSAVQPGQARPAAQQQLAPGLPQYPITATDFYALPVRVMPDYLANEQAALTPEQKAVLRFTYATLLDDFEKQNRKNNMAAALTFAVRASLLAVYGRQLSQAEIDQLGWNFNSVLAANPQFTIMPPNQKQVLYESLIITGGTIVGLQTEGVQRNNLVMQVQAKELGQAVLKQWLDM